MNTTILEQYRQFRQSSSFDLLFQIADRLGCLSEHERHIGKLPCSRYGAVSRRIESALGNPEQIFANAIYLCFYDAGIQAQCYERGLPDETLTAYCQCRSKLYWAGKLSPEEWDLINQLEDIGIDSNSELERSIADVLEQCLTHFGIQETV